MRTESTALAPFLDLALRWNRGISFSLFTQDSDLGAIAPLGLTLAATALLGRWLWRCRSRWPRRASARSSAGRSAMRSTASLHGAVVDYLDLHAFGRHFFVFNLADAAINVGVALLVLDLVLGSRTPDRREEPISPPRAN